MRCSRKDFCILIAMSIIGIISSAMVLYELDIAHTLPPLCQLGNVSGMQINCAKVLLSPYSNISIFGFNISLDFLAVFWFIVNIFLVIALVTIADRPARAVFKGLFAWRFIGLMIVPYLVYMEFFVVHSICVYCTIMHGAILVDFGIISYLVFSKNARIRTSLFGQNQ